MLTTLPTHKYGLCDLFSYRARMTGRATLGRMQNPIRGFLHGGAAVASLVGLALMVVRSWGNAPALTGGLVFGVSLVVMFTISGLYHSIPWTEHSKQRMRRVDHSMIYLVVAGTFTPIAIASLDGITLAIALGLVWALAVTGIFLKILHPEVATWLSLTIQMVMGWSALIWIPAIDRELGRAAVVLILAGGLSYTIGAVIFVLRRPWPLPRTFSYHETFHVLVILGSALHFAAIYSLTLPQIGA